jgi:octaheme c-type cytochrome (tetrathionate reductase family)
MKRTPLLTRFGASLVLALLGFGGLQAAPDHSSFFTGEYPTGPDITTRCLDCHSSEASDFMATIHWTWSHTSGGQDLGKKEVINNYCVALSSNEPRCTSCHAGYGWRDSSFDFTDNTKIDCLVCHDGTGTYNKTPTGAGNPDPNVDLIAVAGSVGNPPTRVACGSCHFYGGGGDAVKHGTMDSTLGMADLDPAIDVHMGQASQGGLGFACVDCHINAPAGQDSKHVIEGSRYSKSSPDNVTCQRCHTVEPHSSEGLNTHALRVACQTCHIPAMARGNKATKTWWDWKTAGEKNPDGTDKVLKDAGGNVIYHTKKGSFVWERDLVPEYAWVNGGVTYTTLESTVTGDEVVSINSLHGALNDPSSRIMPVKHFRGVQPFDSGSATLAVPHLFPYDANDTSALWKSYDWTASLTEGQSSVGRTFVGPVDWVETEMFWVQNHMVAPKEQALTCTDCHTPRGRLDFAGLGYAADLAAQLSTLFGFEIAELDVVLTPGQPELRWMGQPGNIYQVQMATSTDLQQWTNLTDGERRVDAGASPIQLTWSESFQSSGRFYRITRTAIQP